MRIFLCTVFLFWHFSINADILTLKNGKVVEGKYISEDNRSVIFEIEGKKQGFLKKDVGNLELGYTGSSSFCYKLQEDSSEEICNTILHLVDDKKIIVGKGKGVTIKEVFAVNSVKSFTIRNVQKKDKIASVLKKGARVDIKTEKAELSVEVEDTNSKDGKILYRPVGEVETAELKEEDIREISWKSDYRSFPRILLDSAKLAIPGLYQFPRNYWKGGTMIGLFLILGAAIPIEYSNANKALSNDRDYLILNNNLIFASGLNANPQFESHKRNMNAAAGGMAVLFGYHAFDVYITEKNEKGNTTAIQFLWSMPSPDPFNTNVDRTVPNISLKFSHSF